MITDIQLAIAARALLDSDELLPPAEDSIFWDLGDDSRIMGAWERAYGDRLDDVQGYDDEWRIMLRQLVRDLALAG